MNAITVIILAFAILGAADWLMGNKFGLGGEFEKGFSLFCPMALSILGMLVIAPAVGVWMSGIFDCFIRYVWVRLAFFRCGATVFLLSSGGEHGKAPRDLITPPTYWYNLGKTFFWGWLWGSLHLTEYQRAEDLTEWWLLLDSTNPQSSNLFKAKTVNRITLEKRNFPKRAGKRFIFYAKDDLSFVINILLDFAFSKPFSVLGWKAMDVVI